MHFPADDRFNANNFGNQPTLIIEQALQAIAQRDLEIGDLIATPISRSMLYILASKGVKHPESELASINPYGKQIEIEAANKIYTSLFAKTFLELLGRGNIPAWVVPLVDIESLNLVR